MDSGEDLVEEHGFQGILVYWREEDVTEGNGLQDGFTGDDQVQNDSVNRVGVSRDILVKQDLLGCSLDSVIKGGVNEFVEQGPQV